MLRYLLDDSILTNWIVKEEMTILGQFKGLAYVLGVLFLSIFPICIYTAVSAEALTIDIHRADFSKTEVGYVYQEKIYTLPVEAAIRLGGGANLSLIADNSFTYELSQNDKGVESTDLKDDKADKAKEEGVMIENGPGAVFEPIQYCQGRFKKLGGTGVEIITIRCPKVDDSCYCEADKKSPAKWIECGGARKESAIGSELLSCESKIIGPGSPANSE